MILPSIDVDTATDQEILDAYVREGMSLASAESHLRMIRNPDPEFPLD